MSPVWAKAYGSPTALLGYPVDHTLSPPIHNAAFEAADLEHRYFALEVEPEQLSTTVNGLLDTRFLGLNFTVPHKREVLDEIDHHDPVVQRLQAANTLYWKDDQPRLTNTDVYGFEGLVSRWEERIQTNQVLVLGAGGAARACVVGLDRLGADRVWLWNRTTDRARELADDFDSPEVTVLTEPTWPGDQVPGLVINATSLGLEEEDPSPFPAEQIHEQLVGVDLNYGRRTRFLRDFDRLGADSREGLAMLIHQAARAWELWTGKQAPVEAMKSAVEGSST